MGTSINLNSREDNTNQTLFIISGCDLLWRREVEKKMVASMTYIAGQSFLHLVARWHDDGDRCGMM